MIGDEVDECLGIGFRRERIALADEELLHAGVVLDDPVVDDRKPAVAAHMRMGVGVGDAAVGGPAGVADPGGAAQMVLGGHLGEAIDPPDLLDHFKGVVVFDRQAGGIITTVFETFQPLEEDG